MRALDCANPQRTLAHWTKKWLWIFYPLRKFSMFNSAQKGDSMNTNVCALRRAVSVFACVTVAMSLATCATQSSMQRAQSLEFSQRSDTQWETKPAREALSARWEFFWKQRAYPFNAIPAGARLAAMKQSEAGPKNISAVFTEVGPKGFTSTIEPTWGKMSGRARSLLVNPANSSTLYLGTATGGIWKSTNGGTSWTALTDKLDSLSIGSLEWVSSDATNNTFLVGTGEGPNGFYYSAGIFRTTDAGATFSKLAGSSIFERAAIPAVLVDPANASNIVVCVTAGQNNPGGGIEAPVSGLYRSTDAGVTFTQVKNGFCESLRATPGDFAVQYASLTGIGGNADGLYKSTDGGATFPAKLTMPADPNDFKRLNVGIGSGSAANRNIIYAGGKNGANATVLYKSTDAGATFTTLALDYCAAQCFYDNYIEVSPVNPNVVYFGGVGLFRTLDGGSTFDQPGTASGGGSIHVDHHLAIFDPTDATGKVMFELNDGGIYRASDADNATAANAGFLPISNNVGSLQHFDIDPHPTNPNIIFSGNQDNGSLFRTSSDTWVEYCGGDGGYALIDKTTPATMYCSFNFTSGGGTFNIKKTADSGADAFATNVSIATGTDTGEFISPIITDPTTSTTLYAGTSRVYKTVNGGTSWTPASLSGGTGNVTALAVAPTTSTHVWAGTAEGRIERSIDGGVTWTNSTTAALPGRYITSIAVSPTDHNVVYVSFSGFSAAAPAGHIFKSIDGGASWSNSGTARAPGALPDIPVNSIAINPMNASVVYAGTDVGLYTSLNGGATWEKFANFPNAGVSRVKISVGAGILAVGTNGRGTWTTSLSASDRIFSNGFEF